MASTGYQNGADISLFIDGTQVVYGTSHDFEISMSTRDASNKTSEWAIKREGRLEWSASGEFIFAEDATYGFSDLRALVVARTAVVVKITSSESGDKFETGSAYITSISKSAPDQDNVTYSISLEGAGVLTEDTLS